MKCLSKLTFWAPLFDKGLNLTRVRRNFKLFFLSGNMSRLSKVSLTYTPRKLNL